MAAEAGSSATEQAVQADLLEASGATAGTVDLDPDWFGVEPHVPVMHQVVTAQLANARRGTAKTKTRGEVRGGGRKPWRQKGTGRARQGSIRAPQWTGGGIAHGPTGEQNHGKRVNKKMKRKALAGALSDRASEGAVKVVRGLAYDEPKTKEATGFLRAAGLGEAKVLLVLAARDAAVERSFRNLDGVRMLPVDQLNTYDVLRSDVVVLQEEALTYVGTGRRADLDDTREGGDAA